MNKQNKQMPDEPMLEGKPASAWGWFLAGFAYLVIVAGSGVYRLLATRLAELRQSTGATMAGILAARQRAVRAGHQGAAMTMRRYRNPKLRQRIRDLRRAENCERKTHFETRESAQAVRVEMTHGNNSQLAIYVCPVCGKFVLGADRKRARRM